MDRSLYYLIPVARWRIVLRPSLAARRKVTLKPIRVTDFVQGVVQIVHIIQVSFLEPICRLHSSTILSVVGSEYHDAERYSVA
jgi:hypothetical protein